jgi:hypothetical protein
MGRPRRRWEDNINKMDLQEVGWEKNCIWRWIGTGGQLL